MQSALLNFGYLIYATLLSGFVFLFYVFADILTSLARQFAGFVLQLTCKGKRGKANYTACPGLSGN